MKSEECFLFGRSAASAAIVNCSTIDNRTLDCSTIDNRTLDCSTIDIQTRIDRSIVRQSRIDCPIVRKSSVRLSIAIVMCARHAGRSIFIALLCHFYACECKKISVITACIVCMHKNDIIMQ